jgi:hypothetical protein
MRGWKRAAAFLVTSVAMSAAAAAESDVERAQQDRIDELERKVDVLTEELSSMRSERAMPAEDGALEGFAGMGPAASRIYGIGRGLSIGGYAEGYYRNFVQDEDDDPADNDDITDALRTVLYVGYKFSDQFVFNTEIEFEHASTSEESETFGTEPGEVSVEFAALDWRFREWANLRTGLVLVPMGFLNEVHEPPFFNGVSRPEVERVIIPTTWRENGAGIYGSAFEGQLEYRGYVVSALDAQGFRPDGIRDARTSGNRSRSNDLAGVVRLDWFPCEGAMLGGSLYSGEVDQSLPGFADSRFTLWELHAQYRARGFEFRSLYAQSLLGNAADLTRSLRGDGQIDADETIGSATLGAYAEVAYDVMPWLRPESDWYLAPFFRFEYYDTQFDVPNGAQFSKDEGDEVLLYTPGITFKPLPNVAFKLDYRKFSPQQGERADEVEIGFGVAF